VIKYLDTQVNIVKIASVAYEYDFPLVLIEPVNAKVIFPHHICLIVSTNILKDDNGYKEINNRLHELGINELKIKGGGYQ